MMQPARRTMHGANAQHHDYSFLPDRRRPYMVV
jgi:hypothetical protein